MRLAFGGKLNLSQDKENIVSRVESRNTRSKFISQWAGNIDNGIT